MLTAGIMVIAAFVLGMALGIGIEREAANIRAAVAYMRAVLEADDLRREAGE